MTCPTPDKRRYRSAAKARQALVHIRSTHRRSAHVPVRSYQCPGCHGWHLTSWPLATATPRPDQLHEPQSRAGER